MGAVGYASVVAEIATQSCDEGFMPSAIVHCTGSGATQAGLVIGTQAALPNCEVVGIDIDAEPDRVKADVVQYAVAGAKLLNLPFDDSKIEVVAGHAGPAYGIPHDATIDALTLAGRLEAMALDPVYSAKGLAGLIALIGTGRWTKVDHVVFINTGGVPSLFTYAAALPI
jgi:L-cysteate sulfo-lyase